MRHLFAVLLLSIGACNLPAESTLCACKRGEDCQNALLQCKRGEPYREKGGAE